MNSGRTPENKGEARTNHERTTGEVREKLKDALAIEAVIDIYEVQLLHLLFKSQHLSAKMLRSNETECTVMKEATAINSFK